MSTASPLPLPLLPEAGVPHGALLPNGEGAPSGEGDQTLLRRQVAARLEEHRRRRPQSTVQTQPGPGQPGQAALPGIGAPAAMRHGRGNKIADSVAARFARAESYRDFLRHEAEAATRQAEAAAEVARRNAEAIAGAQQRLLEEIEQWNRAAETAGAAEVARAAETAVPGPMASVAETPVDAAIVARAVGHAAGQAALPVMRSATGEDGQRAAQRVPMERSAAQPERPAFAVVFADALEQADPVEFAGSLLQNIAGPLEPTTGLPTNLIEFPRQLVAARKARPRLAEGPLREEADAAPERAQLRIFEVEADAFSTVPSIAAAESAMPEWSSIRLDARQSPHQPALPDSQTSFALPIYTAPVSQRCMAVAVDGCCIGTAFLLGLAAAAYASPELPEGRFALMTAAGSLLLLGVLYLLVFFTFAEATPGMRYARIGLCTFADENPTRKAMRRRLLAMALAAVPLGLGFAWAFLDDDRLGWHDRISRMYQRAY